MATHDDPPDGTAATLLGLTEGDEFWLTLASSDDMVGTVRAADGEPPGNHFDTPGRYHVRFAAHGVTFTLTLRYRERDDGVPWAESLDFRLVEGHEWSIPITPEIVRLTGH